MGTVTRHPPPRHASSRPRRPTRTRTQRRRARTRGRVLLAGLLLIAGTIVTLTDLHGRDQVGTGLRQLSADRARLADTQTALAGAEYQTTGTYQQIEKIETATAGTQVNLTDTNSATTTADDGIFFDGISLPALNICLTGIYQSLDQIDVGRESSAISELTDLAPVCNAVNA